MPAIINSDDGVVSGSSGLKTSGANDGILAFQNNGTEQARITAAGLFQFNSGYGSVATAYGCRAWVNFNGTGTVAVKGSGNVSSLVDDGTGIYTVNFTTAMPDVNYSVTGAAGENDSGGGNRMVGLRVLGTTSVGVRGFSAVSSAVDLPEICIAIFR